jgi:hypothetical protein
MLKQFIKWIVLYSLIVVSHCYEKQKMKLVRCMSCPNITNDNQKNNNINKNYYSKNNQITSMISHYKMLKTPTLNKDYKNIINEKKARSQYLKNRERYNFK